MGVAIAIARRPVGSRRARRRRLFRDNSVSVDLAEPVTIQEALPALLTDHVTVVYVVDDSGSMWEKLLPLHQALHEVAAKDAEGSEIAMLMFGQSHQMLFDFTESQAAPWDTAIPSFMAQGGSTQYVLGVAGGARYAAGQAHLL